MKPCSTSLLKIPLNLNKEICKQVLPAGQQNLPPVSDLSVAHLKVQMYMEPELLGVCLLSLIGRLWAHHQFLPLNRKHQNMSEMPSGSDLTWSQCGCWRDHAPLRVCLMHVCSASIISDSEYLTLTLPASWCLTGSDRCEWGGSWAAAAARIQRMLSAWSSAASRRNQSKHMWHTHYWRHIVDWEHSETCPLFVLRAENAPVKRKKDKQLRGYKTAFWEKRSRPALRQTWGRGGQPVTPAPLDESPWFMNENKWTRHGHVQCVFV